MGPVVMSLDVVKESRGLEGVVVPIQLLHPPIIMAMSIGNTRRFGGMHVLVDSGIPITDGTYVTLEVTDINRVEADLATNYH
jgi:hypothetical protein